ncbi:hypothetical protein GMA10_12520 [Kocuria koreensis]|uniref:Uncharacterized protein n=1 Tax=Rothia koreensis TaxID=592378 RepID=A0A7M3SW57_9MICC|nr:hypothetical protein [Rothia koreensis]MUN56022.1 hypothetical protein [Rothia koreensis]
MAGTKRKSATKTAARERAKAAAEASIKKERRLLDKAEAFFLETFDFEKKRQALKDKIDRLQGELASLDPVTARAGQLVLSMKDEGLTNKEIGERLQLSPQEVRSFLLAGERNADDDKGDTERPGQNNDQHTTSTSGSEEGALTSGQS